MSLIQILTVIVFAATPVFELRGSIPLAMLTYEADPWIAYGLAVFGNLLPVPILLLGLNKLIEFSQRIPWFHRMFEWWTKRTQRKHSKKFERYGAIALILFVAVPLPVTGAWTGSLAAVLFGIPFRVAFPLIAIGVLISGAIVTTLVNLGMMAARH